MEIIAWHEQNVGLISPLLRNEFPFHVIICRPSQVEASVVDRLGNNVDVCKSIKAQEIPFSEELSSNLQFFKYTPNFSANSQGPPSILTPPH